MSKNKNEPQSVVANTTSEAQVVLGGPDTPLATPVNAPPASTPYQDLSTPVNKIDENERRLYDKRYGRQEAMSNAESELMRQVDLVNDALARAEVDKVRYQQALQEIFALQTTSTESEAIKAIARKALETKSLTGNKL